MTDYKTFMQLNDSFELTDVLIIFENIICVFGINADDFIFYYFDEQTEQLVNIQFHMLNRDYFI